MPDTAPRQLPRVTAAIRPVARGDVRAIKAVIDATGLLPAELLVAMIAGYLGGQGGDDVWLTVDGDGPGLGLAHRPTGKTGGAAAFCRPTSDGAALPVARWGASK